jgi:hypothetical protein
MCAVAKCLFPLKSGPKCDTISKGSLLGIDRFPRCGAELNLGGWHGARRGFREDGRGREDGCD